jgi:hypothetical protein
MAAGLAALVLPLEIARALGLCDVSGGRGLLAFTDVDTLVFDAALVLAIASWRRRDYVFWIVAIAALILGPVVAYAVTSYGALIRYRSMLFILLALAQTPLPESEDDTARKSSRRSSSIDQSHMYIRS